jgi:hypothetical protein
MQSKAMLPLKLTNTLMTGLLQPSIMARKAMREILEDPNDDIIKIGAPTLDGTATGEACCAGLPGKTVRSALPWRVSLSWISAACCVAHCK